MVQETFEKQAGGLSIEMAELPRQKTGPLEKVYAFWLAGMSCDGCSIAVTGASDPSVEDLLLGSIPGLPRVVLYHPVLAAEAGEEFVRNFELAAQGKLDAPYVVVLEGSAVDDSLISGDGYWVGLGTRPGHADGHKVISLMEWIDRLAPGAAAMIAIGTCATWGGIPAAAGNATGAMGLMDYLGKDYRSALGLPVINIPGCSPVGENFTEVVAMVLHFLQGTGRCRSSTHWDDQLGSTTTPCTTVAFAAATTKRASLPKSMAIRNAWSSSAAGVRWCSATLWSAARSATTAAV